MKRFIPVIALASIASLASAGPSEGIYIPFGAIGYDFDDSARRLDTEVMPTVGVGYQFDEHWAAEIMAAQGTADVDFPLLNNLEADVTHYRLDGLYFFGSDRALTPFVVAGIGENDIDYDFFGDADDTLVNAGAGLLYQVSEGFALRGDVRAIHSLDNHNTEAAVNLLVQMSFGSGSSTQGEAAPVAAASVVSNNDNDGDGVANANDRCPQTPAGKRVDKVGCDCDYTLKLNFGFDSAQLTAEDRAELDQLADAIQDLGHARAEVAGHTDSRGADAYNQKLSERRAQAVINYLGSKGINTSQFSAVGYGESQPVADNGTDAGRAENRRVVIHRNDCGM